MGQKLTSESDPTKLKSMSNEEIEKLELAVRLLRPPLRAAYVRVLYRWHGTLSGRSGGVQSERRR